MNTTDPHNVTNSDDARLRELNDAVAIKLIPVMVFIGLLMLVGVVGNLLVVIIYTFRLRMGTQNFLIVSLAVLDLLFCFIAMPFEIADLRYSLLFTVRSACRLMRFTSSFCVFASILTLIVIAVDRYLKICRPLKRQMSLCDAKRAMLLVLVVALIYAVPAPILYGIRVTQLKDPDIPSYDCSTDDSVKDTVYPLVYNSLLFVTFLVILALLTVLYVKIWREMKRHARYMSRTSIVGDNFQVRRFSETCSRYADSPTVVERADSLSGSDISSKAKQSKEKPLGKSKGKENYAYEPDPTGVTRISPHLGHRSTRSNKASEDSELEILRSNPDRTQKDSCDKEATCGISCDDKETSEFSNHVSRVGKEDCDLNNSASNGLTVSNSTLCHNGLCDGGDALSRPSDKDLDTKPKIIVTKVPSVVTDSPQNSNSAVTDRQLTKSSTDTDPQQTNSSTDTDPQNNSSTGTDPQQNNSSTDTDPQQNNSSTDTDSQQTNSSTDTDPQQTNSLTDTDPQQTNSSTDTDPQQTNSSTDTDPQQTNSSTDTDRLHTKRGSRATISQRLAIINNNKALLNAKPKPRKTVKSVKTYKATVIAINVTVVFFLSFLPHLCLLTVRIILEDFDKDLTGAALVFYNIFLRSYFINSMSNPIIYGMLNLRFRLECLRLARRLVTCKKQRPLESES